MHGPFMREMDLRTTIEGGQGDFSMTNARSAGRPADYHGVGEPLADQGLLRDLDPNAEPEEQESVVAGAFGDEADIADMIRPKDGELSTPEAADDHGPAASTTDDGSPSPACEDGDDGRNGPRFNRKELAALLDESAGELIDVGNFNHEVDVNFFEGEWLGRHEEISLETIRTDLSNTGRYTADVDEDGKLLSDPVQYRMAVEANAQITLRVHRGWSNEQKIGHVLLVQARGRTRTEAEHRKLKAKVIQLGLVQGDSIEDIAKKAGVCPNTVRNHAAKAAADMNSKFGSTTQDRRRLHPEQIEEIRRRLAEGESHSTIAKELGVNRRTVSKLAGNRDAPDAKKGHGNSGRKPKHGRGGSTMPPLQVTESIAASGGIPQLHRLALKRLGLNDSHYAELVGDLENEVTETAEAVSTDIEELLRLSLYGCQLATAADTCLERLVSTSGVVEDEEAALDNSGADAGEYAVGDILYVEVVDVTSDEVHVQLPDGELGVIDDTYLSRQMISDPEKGERVRVRVKALGPESGHVGLQLLGRQTPTPEERAADSSADFDDRSDPDEQLADRKAGPREKEVV